ncbi:unnamed protein product [Rotaria socialis]|uniref:Uncharacterized protein n=1 Tax=Rotaria socialis TaxID=392032 RepID=A0A818TN34_9BILA|nr:unnamed protein product [Rotaria socialis]
MSFLQLMNNDCCLLTNIDLNSQRVRQLFERRFKSNSSVTSFDFKSFHPEQPSNNAKVSRSLLRFQPKIQLSNDYEDHISTGSSSSEEDSHDDDGELSNNDYDDYLNKLAEWEPENFQVVAESDDDNDDDDDDDESNIFQSISNNNHDQDNEINEMDCSIAEDVPSTSTEDLLITFIHRPIKNEPIPYDDNNIFEHSPQLDGQIDFATPKMPTEPDQHKNEKDLKSIIDKIKAKTAMPSRVIQIHRIPSSPNQNRSNDEVKKKTTNATQKKPISTNPKVDRTKEPSIRQSKSTKKMTPRLLNNLLKVNEDVIREADTRKPSNIQKSSEKLPSSNSNPQSKRPDQRTHLRAVSNEERQGTKSSSNTKQKYILQTRQSKEKPASVHLAMAEKKLNNYQQSQQLKPPLPKISKSNSTPIPSSKNLKSKDPRKISSKSLDLSTRNSEASVRSQALNDHNQQRKKKTKKVKRLKTTETNLLSASQTQTKPPIQKLKTHNNGTVIFKKSILMKQLFCLMLDLLAVQKPSLMNHLSEPSISAMSSNSSIKTRPEDFFSGCIVIDDDDQEEECNNENNNDNDDVQEIQRQHYSISYDIRTREKLLDHAVHSSSMHIKWLFNLEHVLLEHIHICHEKHIRPLNNTYENSTCEYQVNSSYYSIDPSFVSVIIINFIKMFILRNSANDQQELSFVQFGITSHLRYLLIELPTYNHHNDEKDLNDNCFKCHQYSLIINILFDLLFDLIEHDLCEIPSKTNYRSSLIEDDYFTRFLQSNITKNQPYYRIKLIVYFIELIGIHMNKCQNKKQFQFNQNEDKLFHSMEDFIQNIISQTNNSINERISICFNIMELCLLFVHDNDIRMKQMALFLAELCFDNSHLLHLFLFDKNLLVDIRLLLFNEVCFRRFNLKLITINNIIDLFRRVEETSNSKDPIDEFVLLLIRGLFTSYADLITEIKQLPFMYSSSVQQITNLLGNQLGPVFTKLREVTSNNSNYFEKIKGTLIFYRLLECRWNKL